MNSSPFVFQVDREHPRLKLALVFVLVVSWMIAFAILNTLIPSAGLNLVAGLAATALAALMMRVIEPVLKARWPSGRVVQVDDSGVRIVLREQIQRQAKANEGTSGLLWFFKIPRRSRMPKGWYVVACALEQNDDYLAVYTFASPAQVESLQKIGHFTELHSSKDQKTGKNDSLRVAGEQRRLRLAEEHRWHDGAEMLYPDFEQYLTRLSEQFSQWLP
jgi:hypothetical protein